MYDSWIEYRDSFLSLVHNSDELSDIQKFHYLKSSLKGSAELFDCCSMFDSVEFSASNYAVAWELLLNRYNNSSLLVHNHVKALFTISKLTKESPHSLRTLSDNILRNLRALKILGEPTEYWDTLIIFIITSKLDETTEREWEQYKCTTRKHISDNKSPLKVDDLLMFIRDRADMLETLQVSHNSNINSNKQSAVSHNMSHNVTHKTSQHKIHCNVSTNKPQHQITFTKKFCLMCNADHPLYSCQRFLDTDLDTKLQFISDNKLCENCLRLGHSVDVCRFGPCRKCTKKHNTLIHNDATDHTQVISMHSVNIAVSNPGAAHASPATIPPPADSIPRQMSYSQVNSAHIGNSNEHNNQSMCMQPVLLSTAMVEIVDKYNNIHIARALLDCGSQYCFISKALCDLIYINLIQSTCEIRGVGNTITKSTQICEVELKSRINKYSACIKCFVLSCITSTLPATVYNQGAQSIRTPDNIQLADPYYYESQNIDILIGADLFWDLLCEGKMRLSNGPFLQNTKLGWIVSGPIDLNIRNNKIPIQCNFIQSINTQLQELPKVTDIQTDNERACVEHFVVTTTRNDDGRFPVPLPLKQSSALGQSYSQAKHHILALEKRVRHRHLRKCSAQYYFNRTSLFSCPLNPIFLDPHDLTPISPGHFLVGRPLTAPVNPDFTEVPVHRLTRYEGVEDLVSPTLLVSLGEEMCTRTSSNDQRKKERY
ncbi:uncharacterized protein LOC131842124 [Achroia grisella]|uniref:uncharacterized protein LOC131842124 n=1 Tax=Achroia grisella TaxID=688607 RepID=UPI0027D2DB67|nr:uncharacterized protein LOC131842124 [Achroia grisella]